MLRQQVIAKAKAIKRRMRDDFLYYAPRCLTIRKKDLRVERIMLNKSQLYIHDKLEEQYRLTGKIRAMILKGRQQGASTYVELRFFHKVTHIKGARAYILTHLDEATNNLFNMVKRCYDNCPKSMRPTLKASNAKELIFDKLDSGYRVSTAGSKGAGRSDTIQFFHGSEVAFWVNAQDIVAAALQAVPDADGTEIILESTTQGRTGLFFDYCQQAMKGEGEFILVFVPWYWQDEYRKKAPVSPLLLTDEEADYQETYELDEAQMYWRRIKVLQMGGLPKFRQEYPATAEEAFMADVEGALWKRETIQRNRVLPDMVPDLIRLVVTVDPSGGAEVKNDEVGIITMGLGADGLAYLLDDLSGKLTPKAWAERVVDVYMSRQADLVVGEINFGGDMVEANLRAADPNIAFKKITSSRGKAVRAQPVASLCELDRVKFVGVFSKLEDELATWKPTDKKSPNRLDAFVFAATELLLGQSELGMLDHFKKLAEEKAAREAQQVRQVNQPNTTRVDGPSTAA